MSDRLNHLQRQHALLREHLAWIEGEIARESATAISPTTPALSSPSVAPSSPRPPPDASTPPSLPVVSTPTLAPEADALIERYGTTERQNPGDIRRGCFLVFAAALLLVAGVVGAVWVLFYNS